MVKTQWRLLTPDDNTGSNSSTLPDDNGADSSQQQQAEEQVESTEQSPAAEETTSEETATEETVEQTTEEQTTEEATKEVVEKTIDKPEDDKLPFNTHPRFKELVTEKNQFKAEIAESKPLVEQARVTNQFLHDNGITPQEYQSALQYLVALRRDPAQAFAMLKPTYEQLALLQGERLPADLQAKVAAGVLAQEDATELARNRAQSTYQQWKNQQQQGNQQADMANVVGTTIQSWAATKGSIDPDFKSGSPLWELTDKYIKASPPFRNAQEAMNGSEQAYKDAKAFMSKFQPKAAVQAKKKVAPSVNSTSQQSTVMKTADDVVKALARGVKPSQMRYS